MAPSAAALTGHEEYNPPRLFTISCTALATGALVFIIFANIMGGLGTQFSLTATEIGTVAGVWGMGLAIAVFLGSVALDTLGMKNVLGLACLLQLLGVTGTLATPNLAPWLPPYWTLLISRVILGLGHGLIEAAINPLAATVYPDEKTKKLNILHAWWPGGLVIGGLIAYFMAKGGLGWRWQYAVIYLPAVVYGFMTLTQRFPPTERKAAGVPTGDMWREALRPLFIVWFCCMFLTATTELAPGQWVQAMLSQTAQMQGILLSVYIAAIMFVGRFFAGPLAHRFSPVGLMWLSSLLAGIGLYAISLADSRTTAIAAATVWGVGVCYMWPTMLGVTSERFPKGGAVLMGLTGSAGMISMLAIMPLMGRIYDSYTQHYLPAGVTLQQAMTDPLLKSTLDAAHLQAAPFAFRWISLACIPLLIVFAVIWLRDRAAGGYRAEKLTESVDLGQADPGDFSAEAVLETEPGTSG